MNFLMAAGSHTDRRGVISFECLGVAMISEKEFSDSCSLAEAVRQQSAQGTM
jgi:hypothetical protein